VLRLTSSRPGHVPFFQFAHYLQLTGALQKIAVCYLAATDFPVGRLARRHRWILVLNLSISA
jgi:predicted acyltransferase